MKIKRWFFIVFPLFLPVVHASALDSVSNAFQYFFDWMQMWQIMFGITFVFLMILFYGIFAAGIARAPAFGSGGKPNKYGRMVALSLAVISTIGILFVIAGSPGESVKRILTTMGHFGAIAFALAIFGISYLNFKNDEKTWPLAFFTLGLGMIVYSMLIDSEQWFAIGWVLLIIGIIWFLLAENKSKDDDRDWGGGGYDRDYYRDRDQRNPRTRDEREERERREQEESETPDGTSDEDSDIIPEIQNVDRDSGRMEGIIRREG